MSPVGSSSCPSSSWTANLQAKRSRSRGSTLLAHPVRILAVAALLAFAPSKVSAVCEDVDSYLVFPADLGGDMTIEVPPDVSEIACDSRESLEINGGVLTLTSVNDVRFVNLRITIKSGAGLIMDFPTTKIGPEDGNQSEGGAQLKVLSVEEGASVVFSGDVMVNGVEDNGSVFDNYGSMEFKSDCIFKNTNAALFENYGKLRFRASATFKNNLSSALSNNGGTVRFAGETEFFNNGAGYYEGPGSALYNSDGGIVIFDEDVSFTENESLHQGGAVCNYAKIKFYGKAYFFDNQVNDGTGGALYSESGEVKFKGAAQFVGNIAKEYGGGAISMEGGDMRFEKFVTMEDNLSTYAGGAMLVTEAATVDFRKPTKVVMSGNTVQNQMPLWLPNWRKMVQAIAFVILGCSCFSFITTDIKF
eukprot:jgi/Undpi1/10957/HiC_scaffold_30.g13258.m1